MENKYDYFSPSNVVYMLITAVMILVMFLYRHYIVGIIGLCVFVVLIIYSVKNNRIRRHEWKRFIENFSSKLDTATRNTLVRLPFPLIIINNKGNILWYNQNFSLIIENQDVLGKSVKEIFKTIDVTELINGKKNQYLNINIKDKYFDIRTNVVDTSENLGRKDNIMLIYFYDVTEKNQLLKELENVKESVILIEVDNLDEVAKTTPEDKKPLLIAEVERNLNGYAQRINAMFKKYSSGKYVFVIQNKSLSVEMEKKFEILDDVREINVGNRLAVTLSMGIGTGGETPIENYNLAVSAKELALGRGGDQAVVKNGDKLLFYGGNTKEVEKRTKVRARVIGQSLVDLVKESSNIVIMGHNNPDIDCFGGAIGIYSTVKQFNEDSFILVEYLNNSVKYVIDKFYEDEDYANAFKNSDEINEIIDSDSLLILVDVNSRNYVQNQEILEQFKKIVIIDHHRKSANSIEDAIISYIEPYASSTCELVTEMIQYMIKKDYRMKPIEAETLLAGICVDTKNFYFKTGVRTFEAAAYLRKQGADTIDVKKLFSSDLESYIKKSQIIKSAQVIKNIAIAVCPPEIKDTVIAAQAADELLNITGIEASFVLVKIEDTVFISGRSFGDINVQLVLESLGGGGHMTMAGARVKFSPNDGKLIKDDKAAIDYVMIKLKDSIERYIKEGE